MHWVPLGHGPPVVPQTHFPFTQLLVILESQEFPQAPQLLKLLLVLVQVLLQQVVPFKQA